MTPDNGLDGGSRSGRLEGSASTSSGTGFARWSASIDDDELN